MHTDILLHKQTNTQRHTHTNIQLDAQRYAGKDINTCI